MRYCNGVSVVTELRPCLPYGVWLDPASVTLNFILVDVGLGRQPRCRSLVSSRPLARRVVKMRADKLHVVTSPNNSQVYWPLCYDKLRDKGLMNMRSY